MKIKEYKKRKELWKRNYTFQNQGLPRLLLKSMKDFEARKLTRNISDQKSPLHIADFWLFTDPLVFFSKISKISNFKILKIFGYSQIP